MNKRLVWASLVSVMLMLCAPVVLGQASAGNPALYVERLGAGGRSAEVLFVADDGTLSAVPVPGGLYPAGYPDSIRLGDLALSADGTKLAAVFHERASDAALQVVIADLTLNSCCVTLISPLEQVYAYDLAGFSPDGTQIALSFVGAAGSGDFPFTGGMMIVDTASGAPVEITGMEAPMAALSGTGSAVWAQMGSWTENGIQWTPSCYACEPPLEAEYSLWAPQKGTFIARSGVGFSLWADTLA
ncbi:MAG TPA: hypothetical protein VER79_01150, partial [Candidatus Limnocylindrales bacterium]|nr:hypothetical protein [Candidatus Limnocylindrales bacterium]